MNERSAYSFEMAKPVIINGLNACIDIFEIQYLDSNQSFYFEVVLN